MPYCTGVIRTALQPPFPYTIVLEWANAHSTERFLWALYNLGQKGKPYQPEYLHGDFGSDTNIDINFPRTA